MCCLIACKNKRLDLETLQRIHAENGDGYGVAWFNANGKAQYKKGLLPAEVHNFTQTIDLPFILHARAASNGIAGGGLTNRTNKLLCHPFIVSQDSPLSFEGEADKLLFHNGTVAGFDVLLAAAGILELQDNSPMSDTRALAIILGGFDSQEKSDFFLNKLVGRFIVVNSITKQFDIFGHFIERDGILFSNLTWQYPVNEYYSHNSNFAKHNQQFTKTQPIKVSPTVKAPVRPASKTPISTILDKPIGNAASLSNVKCSAISCGQLLPRQRVNTARLLGIEDGDMLCELCAMIARAGSPLNVVAPKMVPVPTETAQNGEVLQHDAHVAQQSGHE